ncbi:hypothetical protein [Paenibacillus sp. Root444D2]|uniref:hypothetical protein n=1 Tax=Paenibacillus sp. Root444D2 TaxID=1736538 RepID=UPI00070DE5E3|nr:hypothetical protein [Paenibacillus sp. Root444D2]KQX51376.1 transposase [Paenibacillus sp. Root444D2]
MVENFVKSLYESIVEENLEIYKSIYETTQFSDKTNENWRQAIGLYGSLSKEQKVILISIIEQTITDTISNVLGIIDGSSTLKGCTFEPKLLLDSVRTDGELQDNFLAYIEDKKNEC